MTAQSLPEDEKEFSHWRDAIAGELPEDESKEFLKLTLEATQSGKFPPAVGARIVLWQFEGKAYGLKHIRAAKEDAELIGFCEELMSLYRREVGGEKIPPDCFRDLHTKIGKAWDIIGWRERDRRIAFARRWAWVGARKWAWIGMRPWSNVWMWVLAAARNKNYARAAALVYLWAEVRTIAKRKIGKKVRMHALQDYFLHLMHTL